MSSSGCLLSALLQPGLSKLCENWGESDREGRIDNDAAFSMSYIRGEVRPGAFSLANVLDLFASPWRGHRCVLLVRA